jgi:hypothetical protein
MGKIVKITKCIECPNTYYKYGVEGHVEIGKPWCSQLDIELTERATTIHKDCPLESVGIKLSEQQGNCNLPQVIKSVCPICDKIEIDKCIHRGNKCSICIE